MPLIGVRELRERMAEVMRRAREEGAEYIIAYQSRPAALLLPLDPESAEEALVDAGRRAVLGGWTTYAQLASQVRQAWPTGQPSQAALDDVRR